MKVNSANEGRLACSNLGLFVAKSSTCHSAGELDHKRVLMLVTDVSAGSTLDSPRAKELIMKNEPPSIIVN